jgi:hypothetical protein
MDPVIRFRSGLFDLTKEPDNPFNPIRGTSILEWIRARLPDGVSASEVGPEDWGWYFDANWAGRTYMLGAFAEEGLGGEAEWAIQFEKSRTFKEKLLGREKLREGDPVVAFVLNLVRGEPAFTAVTIEGVA